MRFMGRAHGCAGAQKDARWNSGEGKGALHRPLRRGRYKKGQT
jgi:hypothetical protein